MTLPLRRGFALLLVVCALAPASAHAQAAPPGSGAAPPAVQLPQDQLDSLLAPIALYPDQLLSQVLMASTYPLDVVAAARFVQENPGLKGEALDRALETKTWDPSVQSLAAFPQVLAMMNDKLDWTQQLGDAFLANEGQLMQTVQSLRGRAQAAGNLQSTPQQKVIVQEKVIIIEPAQPQIVYVPVYNPTVIYGAWWAPAYRPWYWYPPPIYGYPPMGPAFAAGFVWGTAWAVSANHWGWSNTNWHGNNINVNINNNNVFVNNHPQYKNNVANGNWQHSAEQRKGVAYRDASVQNKYQKPNNAAVQSREAYRGRDPGSTTGQAGGAGMQRPTTGQAGTGAQRPATNERPGSASSGRPVDRTGGAQSSVTGNAGQSRPAPAFNANQSRPQTQQYSNRGAQSRATTSAAPARSAGGGGGARPAGGGGGGGRGGGGGGGGRGR